MKKEMIREFDGKQLYYSFLAGAKRLFENQNLINKINVFPVADADTGTNLASTMRSIVDNVIPSENLKFTADAIADAALVGARGNSGIIFAQFLFGFSNEIKTSTSKINVQNFAEIILKAVRYAYEAISNPREGTMISVIKEWAEGIYCLKDKFDDFIKLLVKSLDYASISLDKTTGQLEVLAKANVVDAGAKGFVVFLEGMLEFFQDGTIRNLSGTRNIVKPIADIVAISHEIITFRYCTEALLVGENIQKEKLRELLNSFGDSVVVAGSPQKIRFHVHTDTPTDLFQEVTNFGKITFQKVDDMVMQNEIASNRKTPIGILSDSTLDLPQELIEKHQIQVIPMVLNFGPNIYLDRVTISSEQFYKRVVADKDHPTSSQPSFKEFTNKLNYMSSIYDSILCFSISKKLSGTFSNLKKASKTIGLQTHKNITAISSQSISAGTGLQVLRAAIEAEKGRPYEEIVNEAQSWGDKTIMLAATETTKYMVRSGRLSPMQGLIGGALGIKPVVKVDKNGKVEAFGKPLTLNSLHKKILDEVKRFTKDKKVWNYAITHVDNPKLAGFFEEELPKIIGKKPLFTYIASPVLGANVGPGVTSISILLD
ncbi:MAG: DAK2 domain-containing protein [Bacteroidales bacterium]